MAAQRRPASLEFYSSLRVPLLCEGVCRTPNLVQLYDLGPTVLVGRGCARAASREFERSYVADAQESRLSSRVRADRPRPEEGVIIASTDLALNHPSARLNGPVSRGRLRPARPQARSPRPQAAQCAPSRQMGDVRRLDFAWQSRFSASAAGSISNTGENVLGTVPVPWPRAGRRPARLVAGQRTGTASASCISSRRSLVGLPFTGSALKVMQDKFAIDPPPAAPPSAPTCPKT